MTNKIPVIMLIGSSHCGSTLMDLILDSHSQIKGVGELARFKNRLESGRREQGICGCGSKLKECEFWQKVFYGTDLNNLQPETTERLYRSILAYSGKKIIFDSSKNPLRAGVLSQNPNLDIILLHLVRDGRGVVYSNIKRGRSPAPFMRKWAVSNIKAEIVKLRNRQLKSIFVRYNDFAAAPERVIKHILKEVDLGFEPEMLNFRKKIHHMTPGNYSLLFLNKDSKIKPDMEWKEKLPMKYKILFNVLLGWLNLFYQLKPRKY